MAKQKPVRLLLYRSGFTIVELLVVIVVIGILAALTIVAYTGISQKAMVASLQSDLTNSSKQLKIFQTISGSYPATVSTDCATTPDTTANKCLKLSSGNTITSLVSDYIVNNTTTPQTFSLTIKNTSSSTIAVVTDSSKPSVLTPAPLNPVADWIATYQGDHYGNFYDSVSHAYATVTRAGTKTVYDPATQHIYDVPANQLGVTPRSDGKGGSEAVVEEGRTNYFTNSHFATDTNTDGMADNVTTYNNILGTPIYSLDNSTSVYGTISQRLRYAGVASDASYVGMGLNTLDGSFALNDTATATLFYRGSQTGTVPTLYISGRTATGALTGRATASPPSPTFAWQKYTINLPACGASCSKISVELFFNYVNQGNTVDVEVSAVQIEKGAFATSLIPTTTATVTRNADVVTVPTTNWNAGAGTFVGVGNVPNVPLASESYGFVTGFFTGLPNQLALHADLGSYMRMQATNDYSNSNFALSYGQHVVVGTWVSGGVLQVYQDGSAGTASPAQPTYTTLSSAQLGYTAWGYADGPIQRVIVYNSALSSSNATTVTNAIKDGP